MSKISIQHQVDHIQEICTYYEKNIFSRNEDDKKKIKQLNQAIQTTFTWFKDNEQRIKAALSTSAKEQTNKQQQGKQQGIDDKMAGAVKHAATLCADKNFQEFLRQEWRTKGYSFELSTDPPKAAAHQVRAFCSVKSRAEFGKQQKSFRAWQNLFTKFKQWKQYGS